MTPRPRIAFMIPHFFGGTDPRSIHGAGRPQARAIRQAIFDRVIFQIHALFGPTHHALNILLSQFNGPENVSRLATYPCENLYRLDFDLFVFTTQGQHLLDGLQCPPNYYRHVETGAEPPFLGFECARWMRDHPGYDLYCYLEDDIILRDPLFFAKIAHFNQTFDADNRGLLLMPQPYEEPMNAGDPQDMSRMTRLYVNYQSQETPSFSGENLVMDFAGLRVTLEPALNPHGCMYVLTPGQAARVVRHPDFLDKTKIHSDPGDTAGSGFVMRALKIYKPAKNSLSFLEVQHGHQSILRLRFE